MTGATMKKTFAMLLCVWSTLGWAQSAEELLAAGKNPDNVTNFGMGYDLKMYSPLKQIDKSNAKRLVPVWSFSLANDMGEHSQPTVYNGVMYVVNGNWTFAIDVATGRQIWRTPVQYEREALRVGSAGALMRGPATIYNGKLFRQTVGAHVMALDMKTGKDIWKTKFAEYKEGYLGVVAPVIVNGVLISGMAGGDRTTRGFLDGYDPEAGKRPWRTDTTPPPGAPGPEAGRLLRPAARPLFHRHGQRRAVQPRVPQEHGQLVLREHPRDPAEDRRDGVALPDGAERQLRLRCHRRELDRRSAGRRPGAQGAHQRTQERLSVRHRPHQRQADRGEPVREGQLGLAHRPQDRPAGADRPARARDGRRDRERAPFARYQRVAHRLQSEDRARVHQLVELSAAHEVRGLQVSARRRLDRHRVHHGNAQGRAGRLSRRHRAAHGQSRLAGSAGGHGVLRGHDGDGRRTPLHGPADGRGRRARPGQRQDALAVQDRLLYRRPADYLHAQRAPVRDRAVRSRRQRAQPRGGEIGPARRLGVDVCLDA